MVTRRLRGFLDRFVHPRVAAVALGGGTLIVLASLVAVVGVALMNLGTGGGTGAALVGISALISLLGIVLLFACGGYLAVLWLLRDVFGLVG